MLRVMIFIFLILNPLFSKTIVVDKNGFCMPWMGCINFCDSGEYETTTIRDALQHTNNGDTIKICPATYNEENLVLNKSNVYMTSTKTNSISEVKISGRKFPTLTIHGWVTGIHFNKFEIDNRRGDALRIENGGADYHLENMIIHSSRKYGVYVKSSVGDMLLENLEVEGGKDALHFENSAYGKVRIENSKFHSSKDIAINFQGALNNGLTIRDSVIKGRDEGLHFERMINNNRFIIENSDIDAQQGMGINFQNSINSPTTFNRVDIRSKDKSIYLKKELNRDFTFSKSTLLSSRKEAMRLYTINSKLSILDSNLTTNSTKNSVLLLERLNRAFLIRGCKIEKGKYGVYLKYIYSPNSVIENNIFKNSQKEELYIPKTSWQQLEVISNCFYGKNRNALVRDHLAKFKRNYYNDYGGTGNYLIPDLPLYDYSPQLTCSLTNPNSYHFDAKEIFRPDKNITTKVVNRTFSLQILSDKPFSGTVCSAVVNSGEDNVSNWQKSSFANETFKNVSFKVGRAVKDAKIKIAWLKNADAICPLTSETNHTLSTDNFAVRPKEFKFSSYPKTIFAGGEFKIEFDAVDENGKPTKNYNEKIDDGTFTIVAEEVKSGCHTGAFKSDATFINGTADSTNRYNEMGVVNLEIRENNNTPFASVDLDDTPLATLLISPAQLNLNSEAYDAIVNISLSSSPIFMDKNLTDNYAEVNITTDVVNKSNTPLRNFVSHCYAKDINFSFTSNYPNNIESFKGIYNFNGVETDDSKFEKLNDYNWTIGKNQFYNGENNSTLKFSIYKNRAYPVSIVDLNLTKMELYLNKYVTKSNSLNKILSFYYLSLLTPDIYADNEKSSSALIDILVYDKNRNHFSEEKELYWFWYNNYPKDDVKVLGYSDSFKYDLNLSNFSVAINKQGGEFNLSIDNSGEHNFAVIHLQTPNYLWYSRYKDYNDSLNSYCLTHYCVEYHYNGEITHKEIGSGKFKGSEVNVTTRKRRIGIKMYR